MLKKEEYTRFALSSPELPLFLQPWWLDAAISGEGEWDVLIKEKDGKTIAALPFCYKKRLGITNIFIPWCTPYLAVHPPDSIHTEELIGLLPSAADYRFRLFPGIDPEAWCNQGYTAKAVRTYRIDSPDLATFTAGIFPTTARQIRKAEKLVKISQSQKIEAAYRLWEANMRRKKVLGAIAPFNIIKNIDEVLSQKQNRQLWEARDTSGNLHAAIYTAFDQKYMYYLWGGYDIAQKASGATSLLFYHAITEAIKRGLIFDFEGSMVDSVARFYRGFGAIETSVYAVHKTPSLIGRMIKKGK